MKREAKGGYNLIMKQEPKRILIEVQGEMPKGDFVLVYDHSKGHYVYKTMDALFQPLRGENARLMARIERAEEAIKTLSKSVETFGDALKENL